MKNQKIRSMKVHEQSGYNYKASDSALAVAFFNLFTIRPEKCRSNPLRKLGGFCSLLYRNEV